MNKSTLMPLLPAFAMSFVAVSCNMQEQNSAYENATSTQAYQIWQQNQQQTGKVLFPDVRTADEFAQGYIPGARLLPVQQLTDRMHEIPKDVPVYVYCVAGVRSSRSANMLVNAGFTNIINMPDGFPGWVENGYPIQQEQLQ